jgi:hypothetical protein
MIAIPNCIYCRHSRLPESKTCIAFPEGIPREIFMGERTHRKPYPGDHGILFAPKPDAPAYLQDEVPVKEAVTVS